MTPTITIEMDKKCLECGKGGATDCGICLKCVTAAITGKKQMHTEAGKTVQKRFDKIGRASCRERVYVLV